LIWIKQKPGDILAFMHLGSASAMKRNAVPAAGVPFRESNMSTVREPRLTPVAILDLRPTQFTVGMREVKENASVGVMNEQRKVTNFSANI
jgi:hypothetical protein